MSAETLASPQETGDEGTNNGSDSKPSTNGNTAEGKGTNDDDKPTPKPSQSAVQVITRFMCKFCGKQFIRRADMDAHALLHDEERPPLTCGVCGKVYNTRSKLQRHVRVHSGERPFPCSVCGKRFPRSDHVKQHMRVHARLSGEDVVVTSVPLGLTHKSHCRLCGVKFEDRSELGKHLLTHGFNKLHSCIYCGEVFECNEKLKKHKQTHENPRLEEYLPVLTIPDPSMSSKNGASASFSKNAVNKRKPGRPKGSKTVNHRRRKEIARLGFSKFKITRRSGSEAWQTVAPVLKTEETESPNRSASTSSDHSMPILERMLLDNRHHTVIKLEKDDDDDFVDNNSHTAKTKSEENSEDAPPQMSISACYSLAEGQDNSDIPDIDEIRASTLLEGSNMIMLPAEGDLKIDEDDDDEDDDDDDDSSNSGEEKEKEGSSEAPHTTSVCAVTATRSVGGAGGRTQTTQVSFIRPKVLPATATATLMTLQQQTALAASSSSSITTTTTLTATTTTITTRPTISLLPNVLAFRTHPLLTTPTLSLTPHAVQPTVTGGLYNNPTARLYNPLGNFPALPPAPITPSPSPATTVFSNPPVLETFPSGRKMMRCQHCCIWFEDSALGLLHQSLHSADDSDPFTCKKCLKRLGNRLEFTAHIIWHLDPTMEENSAL